ncbi:MAG: PPC domain-containing protein [Candidatus Eisenbacteria bacterium]
MRLVLALVLTTMLCSGLAFAAPGNEDPKPWSYDTSWARSEYPEQEPNDTCPGQATACGDVVTPAYLDAGNEDWYSFTVNAGDAITVGTQEVNPGDYADTYIELYFECGGTILAEDDDSGPSTYSLIQEWIAPQTGTYNLKVRGFSASSYGPYEVFFQCGQVVLPEGDQCDTATEITCGTGTLNGDLTTYHNDYNPYADGYSCTGYNANDKDVVFILNMNEGDSIDLTYTTPSYDGSMYIITDCADAAHSCVIGEDDPEPEHIAWTATATGTYYLILDGYSAGAGGPWTLDYIFDCVTPPTEGACCFPDGSCAMLLPDDCTLNGGDPQGEGTTCESVECEIVATQDATWGQIKATYR